MADTCKSCLHFMSRLADIKVEVGRDGASIPSFPGLCAWVPPPMLTRLHAMAQSEESNRIAYVEVMRDLPPTQSDSACSCWTPASPSAARLRRLMRN